MLMLQHPFPSELRTSVSDNTSERALGEELPIHTLPRSVVALSCATHCSLAKYRCASRKWRHLAFLVVGSWAFASSAASRTAVMAFYLEAMNALVASVAPSADKTTRNEADAMSDDEDKRSDFTAVVVDGEHLVLASLTIPTFPFVFDAVVMCAIASLASAAPKATRSAASERASGPFDDICDALAVAHNVLRLYVDAERAGFDLPVKTYVSCALCCHSEATVMAAAHEQTLSICVSATGTWSCSKARRTCSRPFGSCSSGASRGAQRRRATSHGATCGTSSGSSRAHRASFMR